MNLWVGVALMLVSDFLRHCLNDEMSEKIDICFKAPFHRSFSLNFARDSCSSFFFLAEVFQANDNICNKKPKSLMTISCKLYYSDYKCLVHLNIDFLPQVFLLLPRALRGKACRKAKMKININFNLMVFY